MKERYLAVVTADGTIVKLNDSLRTELLFKEVEQEKAQKLAFRMNESRCNGGPFSVVLIEL